MKPKMPPACIVLGMAGSGKTSLMRRIAAYLSAHEKPAYHINLDPAVSKVPFGANIDICDTVNYREVMKQYGLGPNGAIMTSLNLFATRFEEVMQLLEKRVAKSLAESEAGGPGPLEYVFVDTPGQIEVFTWSASGDIITKMLGSTFPTVLLYVVDTSRCTNATTFMSNML
jgi:GTPase SAR1 family protein